MHYYTFHLGDYAKDTGHLSLLEHGAYRTLLDHAYAREVPLPLDEEALFRLCKAFTAAEKKAVRSVLGEFFRKESDGHIHKRVQIELQKAGSKSTKAASSAHARWKDFRRDSPQAESQKPDANALPPHSEGNANAERRQSEGNATHARPSTIPHSPSPKNHSPEAIPPSPKGGAPGGGGAAALASQVDKAEAEMATPALDETADSPEKKGGGPRPCSLAEAQAWAEGYSKGNPDGLVIDTAVVTDWFDWMDAIGWVIGQHDRPLCEPGQWQASLKMSARRALRCGGHFQPPPRSKRTPEPEQPWKAPPPPVAEVEPTGWREAWPAVYGAQPCPATSWHLLPAPQKADLREHLKQGGRP